MREKENWRLIAAVRGYVKRVVPVGEAWVKVPVWEAGGERREGRSIEAMRDSRFDDLDCG